MQTYRMHVDMQHCFCVVVVVWALCLKRDMTHTPECADRYSFSSCITTAHKLRWLKLVSKSEALHLKMDSKMFFVFLLLFYIRIQKIPRLLVAAADGYLYLYNLDPQEGGECTLMKQHR